MLGGGGRNKLLNKKGELSTRITNNGGNTKIKQSMSLALAMLFLILSLLILVFDITYSALKDSKSATGAVTFEIKSPSLTFVPNLNFYHSNNTLYYGSSTVQGVQIENAEPFNMIIDSENLFGSYYVQVKLVFDSLTQGISFNSNSYFIGNTTMTSMQEDASTIEYDFVSNSNDKVNVGELFDLIEYLKDLNLEIDDYTPNFTTFKIIIVVDSSNTFSSSSRTQTTLQGNLGIQKSIEIDYSISSNFDSQPKFDFCQNQTSRFGSNNYGVKIWMSAAPDLYITIPNGYYYAFKIECNTQLINIPLSSNEEFTKENDTVYRIITRNDKQFKFTFTNDENNNTTLIIESLSQSNGVEFDFLDDVLQGLISSEISKDLFDGLYSNSNASTIYDATLSFYASNDGNFSSYNLLTSKEIKIRKTVDFGV